MTEQHGILSIAAVSARKHAAPPSALDSMAVAPYSHHTGRKSSKTLTVIITPAARPSVKASCEGEGSAFMQKTTLAPREVAAPAMADISKGIAMPTSSGGGRAEGIRRRDRECVVKTQHARRLENEGEGCA